MDALDEFFRLWSEPEAWCQRCTEYPAMHVAVHDKTAPEGLLITYVRIWDPALQEHIALCRRCSGRHLNNPGRQAPQYLPPLRYPMPVGWQLLLSPIPQWWQYVSLWYNRLRFWLLRPWYRTPRAAAQPGGKRYTGTSSNN